MYIPISVIPATIRPDFTARFRELFGEEMELTLDNLYKLQCDRWHLPVCLSGMCPNDEERIVFKSIDVSINRGVPEIYEKLKEYCGKPSLVDKLVKACR